MRVLIRIAETPPKIQVCVPDSLFSQHTEILVLGKRGRFIRFGQVSGLEARSLKSVSPKKQNYGVFMQLGSRGGVVPWYCVFFFFKDDTFSYQTSVHKQLVTAALETILFLPQNKLKFSSEDSGDSEVIFCLLAKRHRISNL